MSIATQLEALPTTPGVYLFKNAAGHILYVGKAKVLRNRVRSYFRANAALDPAKQQMVGQVATIETISCDTENEALVLEANLIRDNKPPYNIVLTDDKYYLFIKITKEALPRVFPVRRLSSDGARYFGPYSSASAVRHTLKLLRRLFPHRGEKDTAHDIIFPHPLFPSVQGPRSSATASFAETREKIASPPGEVASTERAAGGVESAGLNPHQYQDNIRNIVRFLQGDRESIMATLRDGMQAAAREKSYERAALFRDQLAALERLEGSQKVYLPTKESFDVVSIATAANRSAANVFAVRNGKLLNKNTFLLRHRHLAQPTDVVRQFILQYYRVAQDIPNLILVPEQLPDHAALAEWINPTEPPTLLMPQRGKKRQLLEMGVLNAKQLLTSEEIAFVQSERLQRATAELARALHLDPATLHRIETYDISNIQGTLATGSLVVFRDGQPEKSQYKKFRIRREAVPNDFAMLQEVLRRRFSNRHPDWPLPDLIMIDGGKGQLSAAQRILTELNLTIPVVALAKREEELFTPGEKEPIRLPYNADALYLIQRMRDEAHRFTLTYHQLLRSKRASRSLLDEVPGIGPKTKRLLLTKFGSLKAIRAATESQLAEIIGEARAKTLREYL